MASAKGAINLAGCTVNKDAKKGDFEVVTTEGEHVRVTIPKEDKDMEGWIEAITRASKGTPSEKTKKKVGEFIFLFF